MCGLGTGLSQPLEPNALWCADYKGEFMLGNRRYCYPLTVTDFRSHRRMRCTGSASYRSGGCGWGFRLTASNRDIRNRTVATSGCSPVLQIRRVAGSDGKDLPTSENN